MDIEPFLIASALKMVISQRLVKRLCPECARAAKITDASLIGRIEGHLDNVIEDDVADIEFSRPVGCAQCDMTGYKGRMGVHEVLVMDERLDNLVLGKASVNELEDKARELGMITIMQDGLIKAATGKTTIEEIMKLA